MEHGVLECGKFQDIIDWELCKEEKSCAYTCVASSSTLGKELEESIASSHRIQLLLIGTVGTGDDRVGHVIYSLRSRILLDSLAQVLGWNHLD